MVDVKIRRITIADLSQAMSLSADEGWNQNRNDWRMVLDNPDDICLGAEKDNVILGSSNTINYGKEVAWIGMVLVRTEHRGKGLGKLLFRSILENLGDMESVKLDATPAGQPLYAKFGFIDEYRISRMIIPALRNVPSAPVSNKVLQTTPEDMPGILTLDRQIFGADRSYVLKRLFRDYPRKAFVLKEKGTIKGYAFGRGGVKFSYIGPVYSSSADEAQMLISAALKDLSGMPVALDVPEDKIHILEFVRSAGFSEQRYFTRMYFRSNKYRGKTENQFLICGPEFG
jgi:GNAT superfamily N-acetyltransferase